jgi:hypothetical protein
MLDVINTLAACTRSVAFLRMVAVAAIIDFFILFYEDVPAFGRHKQEQRLVR